MLSYALSGNNHWRCYSLTPADLANPTPDELSAIQEFGVRYVSVFIGIMFGVDGSVKVVIGNLEVPKFIWELLEQRYGDKQEGL